VFDRAAQRRAFENLQIIDQAKLIEMHLERRKEQAEIAGKGAHGVGSLGNEVKRIVNAYRHVSVAHALLAALPTKEFVTPIMTRCLNRRVRRLSGRSQFSPTSSPGKQENGC